MPLKYFHNNDAGLKKRERIIMSKMEKSHNVLLYNDFQLKLKLIVKKKNVIIKEIFAGSKSRDQQVAFSIYIYIYIYIFFFFFFKNAKTVTKTTTYSCGEL